MSNPRIGSSFEDFLEAEGIREEAEDLAQKRVIAWQIEEAMKRRGITKVEMARRMRTSRTQVDRLLDPTNNKVQLDTLQRAAHAVGARLKLELLEATGEPA
ncbi:MAG: XRE family transcriptional regulator [Gemmatimonadetes bacterium]|nr:XRE family transcriptional regulator [Gemmatimonadota bacterium]